MCGPLLHYLILYSLPTRTKRVVAGTRMTKFANLVKSGAAKGVKHFDLATMEPDLNFPYVDPDEAWEVLNRFINMDGISQENKTQGQHVLQGRLRYILRIIVEIFSLALTRGPPLTFADKNTLFMKALATLKKDITNYINSRVEDLVARNVHQQTMCKVVIDILPPAIFQYSATLLS
jgi:hypothetical protein